MTKTYNYQLLKDAYSGSGGFSNGAYLTKHKRESNEDYRFRRETAYYLNYFAPIVNALVDPIFRHPPLRDYTGGLDDIIAEFLNDVDGSGMSMDTFMKRAAIVAKVYGVAFIVVDMMQEPSARSMSDVLGRRVFPYLRICGPDEINGSEWGIDKGGNLTYIEFREIAGITDGTIQYRYCRYGLDGWQITGDNLATTSGEYNLGRVPVIPLFSRLLESKTMTPAPDLLPIAKTAKALYNTCSWLDEILRNETFPLLTIPTLDASELTIGTNNALGYSPDSSHEPAFIAPPDGPATVLQAQRDSMIANMYRMASLSYMQQETTQQISGVARQWEFERTNQQLATFARNIGEAEELALQVFGRYLGYDIEYTVTYPDDFGIVDVEGELKQAQEVLDLDLTPELKQEVLKKVVAAYTPDLPDDRFDELMDSLKKEQVDRENAETLIQPNDDEGKADNEE